MSSNLYSFDIFDTLVTRRVAVPTGIFTIMQEILIENTNINKFLKNNFYQIRIGAEEFAKFRKFQFAQHYEITFDEIYNVIQNNYNLSDEETKFLKQLEISTEIHNLLPINKNLSILKNLIAQKKRVILISDMYYGEKYLREILIQVDPIFNNIKIYSSADYNASKANMDLYKIVKANENIEYKDWTHYGDNKHSDIQCAKNIGINTVYTPQEPLLRYEEQLLKHYSNNYFYQATIGSAKAARLNKPQTNSDKYDFGASFAGTILYNYVDWVLNQALNMKFKTIYFIARDGYIPKVIADVIIEKRHLPIKTKYLYGSRIAWRNLTDENYEMLIVSTFNEYKNRLTPNFLAYRFGIDKNKMTKLLGLSSPEEKIKHNKIKNYIELCIQDEKIKQTLLETSKKRVELLEKYLLQEIDFEENNIAFVDLHGSGKTQDCMALILNNIKPCKLYGFYLSTNLLLTQSEHSLKLSYFSSKKYMSHWVELLSRNTDGQTIGYKEENEKILPVTEKGNGEIMLKWGFNEYLSGTVAYTNNMLLLEEKNNNIKFNTVDLYCKYFDYLTKDLDKSTAIILGEIPYLVIGKEDGNIFEAAPKIRTLEVLLNLLIGKKLNKAREFPYISAARSSVVSKKLQELIQDCPTLQKFLFNVYIHKKHRKAFVRILGIKFSFGGLLWKN